ncbi:MAG TPA: hypothetical protein VFI11_01225 [Anaerolineales bacterium]|nr:hypothetical protein [Anaerolineales bacterium]
MASAACPSCGTRLNFRGAPKLGARLTCPACGTRLEVLGATPIELDWAFDGPIQEQVDPVTEGVDEFDVDDGLAKY